jgi:hypothetical protein
LKIATWSPGVTDVDLALIATPDDTLTDIGSFADRLWALVGVAAIGASNPSGNHRTMLSKRRLNMNPGIGKPLPAIHTHQGYQAGASPRVTRLTDSMAFFKPRVRAL